jgi:hypothetical protein
MCFLSMDIDSFMLNAVFVRVQYVASTSGLVVYTVLWRKLSSHLSLFFLFRYRGSVWL